MTGTEYFIKIKYSNILLSILNSWSRGRKGNPTERDSIAQHLPSSKKLPICGGRKTFPVAGRGRWRPTNASRSGAGREPAPRWGDRQVANRRQLAWFDQALSFLIPGFPYFTSAFTLPGVNKSCIGLLNAGFTGDSGKNPPAKGDMSSIPEWGRTAGEGNGNPLQYSCLENSVDRGAWLATVQGIATSWTRWAIDHSRAHKLAEYPRKLQLFNSSFLITCCFLMEEFE